MPWQDDAEHYQEGYWNPIKEYNEQFKALRERKTVIVQPSPGQPTLIVHCKTCSAPIDIEPGLDGYMVNLHDPHCQACSAMLDPLISSSYWQSIQREWEDGQKRKRILIQGD